MNISECLAHGTIGIAIIQSKLLVAQLCTTLCDPTDCSLPGSYTHAILQARILEWVAIPFSRGSSQPTDRTWVSCIAARFFTFWAAREAHENQYIGLNKVYC